MGRKGFTVGTAGGGRKGDSLEYVRHVPKFLQLLKTEEANVRTAVNNNTTREQKSRENRERDAEKKMEPLRLGAEKLEISDDDESEIEMLKRAGFKVNVEQVDVEAEKDKQLLERFRDKGRGKNTTRGVGLTTNSVAERIEKMRRGRRRLDSGLGGKNAKTVVRDAPTKNFKRKTMLSFQDSNSEEDD